MMLFIFLFFLSLSAATTDVTSCSCGFLDSRTGAVWTDAIIAYANETALLADSLVAEDYQHSYEKNWNARYRAGATSSNLIRNESTAHGWNGSAWVFKLNKPEQDHAVVGASLRSLRRDIQYGTFESAMMPPKAGAGGSVLSMKLEFNETQTVNLNVMNADDPKDAWTSFMIYGDWRGTRSKGVNFTDFSNSTYNYTNSPWGFVPYRIDWNDTDVNFFFGDALARTISSANAAKDWPTTPSALYFRHSSIGDSHTSEGPPPNGSDARVGMIRAFFNSSLMGEADHDSFDKRCRQGPTCLVQDISLRGQSSYSQDATLKFKEPAIVYRKRWPAIFVASICLATSTLLLLHAFLKRGPWKKNTPTKEPSHVVASVYAPKSPASSENVSVTHSMNFTDNDGLTCTAQLPGTGTPGQNTPGYATPAACASGTTTPSVLTLPGYFPPVSSCGSACTLVGIDTMSPPSSLNTLLQKGDLKHKNCSSDEINNLTVGVRKSLEIDIVDQKMWRATSLDEKKSALVTVKEIDGKESPSTEATGLASKAPIAAPKQRVDYLAGLVALASIMVTLIHFCLTFLPATEIPYSLIHYQSEVTALKIVTPYLLTFSLIGPFFTTSTRFLVASYLKSGNLKGIAEKAVSRTPRLIIPCAVIAALEYFCMQVGAITWLEYLPSITYSTWPYTSGYVTFGHFISEVLELAYIIPNAVPQITFNYCIGVLWTIPVQLQNSWLSLLGVLVIREIKTPWKRIGYYTFCIAMHWYATSWGSFFWVGLLIADLDITYKWKTWLYARSYIYYPFIAALALLAAGSPSIDLVANYKTWNFSTLEYGIHPHQKTGQLIRNTSDCGYPPYYIPRLTALTFSIGFHLLVELSPIVQKFFSNRLLIWLFPHILTLYLIHGLVFWSLGAMICVHLAAHGIPYWANMLITAVCSYIVIFGCLPFLTPVVEGLGRSITRKIWQSASSKPLPRRKTLYPFSADLFKGAEANDTETEPKSDDVEKNGTHVMVKAL